MGERRLCIRDLNPHIVCILCAGYFVDATTITECLHTFCKSCIVKYLQTSKHCPMCNVKIHDTQPLFNLKFDRVMQEIVYKLVPNLMENEENRRADFDKNRSLNQLPKPGIQKNETYIVAVRSEVKMMEDGLHSYLYDEQISLCLEPVSLPLGLAAEVIAPGRKYVRCSVRTQIIHIKRLIPRLWPCSEGQEIDILCLGESMLDQSCLKYIWLAKWIDKAKTLTLQYCMKCMIPYSFHMVTPMLNGIHK